MLHERLIIVYDSRAAAAKPERSDSVDELGTPKSKHRQQGYDSEGRTREGRNLPRSMCVIEYGSRVQLGCALAWGRVKNEGTIESVCVRGKPRIWRDLTPL